MAFRLKKATAKDESGTKPSPRDPRQDRLSRLASPELYNFVETSLMSAQQNLSKYRQAPNNLDALAALEWASTDAELAGMGMAEIQSRLLDK